MSREDFLLLWGWQTGLALLFATVDIFFFLLFSWMIIILIDNNSVAERMLC